MSLPLLLLLNLANTVQTARPLSIDCPETITPVKDPPPFT